ncbi:hypothetical protein [Actinocrispum sp. NPDC049592]|uniref:hypothetical protein n=1 Tax=Actinocrispum sp. NPDC049592 TaxID=3154835 RepID=UPI00343B9DC4
MSTKTLCRTLSDVSIALEAYADVPDVDSAYVTTAGSMRVILGFPYEFDPRDEIKLAKLCAWADRLGTTILIELSYGGSGSASIAFELGGHPAQIRVDLHSGQAYELGAALRRPITTDSPSITIAPSALREALAATGIGTVT